MEKTKYSTNEVYSDKFESKIDPMFKRDCTVIYRESLKYVPERPPLEFKRRGK